MVGKNSLILRKLFFPTVSKRDFIDNRSHITEKKLSHVKYSPKRSDYLRFYLYLCQVIDDLERNQFTIWKLYERRF